MESTIEKSTSAAREGALDPERQCPRCHEKLTLREIIWMMHGSGYDQFVWVETPKGRMALVEAGDVDPTQVEVICD
jgi:hypothetical protein